MKKKETQLPPNYAEFLDYYYLRDFDLFPEQVRNCPYNMLCEDFIDTLIADGLLFNTKKEALNARQVMLSVYNKYRKGKQ